MRTRWMLCTRLACGRVMLQYNKPHQLIWLQGAFLGGWASGYFRRRVRRARPVRMAREEAVGSGTMVRLSRE
jgi:hypothetical protein